MGIQKPTAGVVPVESPAARNTDQSLFRLAEFLIDDCGKRLQRLSAG